MVPTRQTDRQAEVSQARAAPTNPRSSCRLVWSFSGGLALVFAPFFFLIWGLSSDSISPLFLVDALAVAAAGHASRCEPNKPLDSWSTILPGS